MELQRNTLSYINGLAKENPQQLVADSEARFEQILNQAADKIIAHNGRTIVMLAGPSASGKTTTAHKLCAKIKERGTNCFVLSLDDFYLDRAQIPGYDEGKPDYETVHALDLPLLNRALSSLLCGQETDLPIFDFTVGRRAERGNRLKLEAQDSIIVEGLHALNPIITDALPEESLFKAYISVSSRIKDGDEILLNKRDMRFMRRLVRDYLFRASSVENTLNLWKSVRRGEDAYLFPYSHLANLRINSIHYCEPCLFAPLVTELLESASLTGENEAYAKKLLSALRKFEPISASLVAKDSLLREFLGQNTQDLLTK